MTNDAAAASMPKIAGALVEERRRRRNAGGRSACRSRRASGFATVGTTAPVAAVEAGVDTTKARTTGAGAGG